MCSSICGAFGDVSHVQNTRRGHRDEVMKSVRILGKSDAERRSEQSGLVDEVRMMMLVGGHVNVLQVLGCMMLTLQQLEFLTFLEYVGDGRELADVITKGELTVVADATTAECATALRRLLTLALQLARGLAHIHSRCVLHNDVKPENCMVTEAGALKVVDLGLATKGSLVVAPAAEEGEAAAAAETEVDDSSTDIEARFGGCTPTYASPQATALQNAEPSAQSLIRARDHDGWAFVAVVIEMIVGRAAGQHGNNNERLTKMAERAVPIEVARAWTTTDVQAWLATNKRLAKLAAPFAERGVDGAAMLRIDKRTLKREFGRSEEHTSELQSP